MFSQTKQEKEKITSGYDKSAINRLQAKLEQQNKQEKDSLHEIAKRRGIPLIIEDEKGFSELQKILPDGTPIYYTTNKEVSNSTKTNHLNSEDSLHINSTPYKCPKQQQHKK